MEFRRSHGDWIRLLRANSFEIDDLIDVRPPVGEATSYAYVTEEWARRWPCEEAWKMRKRSWEEAALTVERALFVTTSSRILIQQHTGRWPRG